ncbi:unnamed protein product [Symbiodinium sp. KB8]|nr:unnamed protein product [Symbiodinium sp. KB8]
MDALAAASAKQPAVPTTMSKSMAMPFVPSSGPAPMAPWHKTSPLPAPPSAPWRSATLPAPPQKASAPSTPWPLQSPSLHSDGLPSFVDRVAGVLGPAAGSDVLPLEEYKSRLATIYSVHNPSNVSKIGYLLSKYKDQEQLLYQSVCSKYQIPSTWDGRQPLPSLPFATQVQPSETQHKDQAAQGSPVNGSAKPNAAIPPPWAREKATTLPRVDLSKSESKEADDDFFESEAALKALQILTQDMGEPTRLPKQLKPAPEVPSAKGMAKIDYFLLGEKTGFFSDEETVEDVFGVLSDAESEDEVKDQGAIDLQEDEEKEKLPATAEPGVAEGKSPTEAQEKPKKDEEEKPEDGKADIREAEDVDQEEEREKSPILAQPVMPPESSELQKEELRKAEERQRRTRAPKRKLPEPKAASKASEATLASTQPPPAANPQRAEPPGNADDDDDDEVVVLSVSAGDKILNQENGKRKVSEQEAEEKQTKPSLEEMAAEEKDTGAYAHVLLAYGLQWATASLPDTFVISVLRTKYWGNNMAAHGSFGKMSDRLDRLSGPSLIFPKDPDRRLAAGLWISTVIMVISAFGNTSNVMFALVSDATALEDQEEDFWFGCAATSLIGMLQEADRQILNKEDSVNRGQDVEFDAGFVMMVAVMVQVVLSLWYGSGGRKLSLDNQGWLKSLRNKGQSLVRLPVLAIEYLAIWMGPTEDDFQCEFATCETGIGVHFSGAKVDNCDDDDDDEDGIQGEEGGGHLETVWWADGIALVLDESYSQSSDDEEDMNDAPGAADNGTAPKGERSVRDTLLGEIFQDLQDFSGTPGRATMKAVKHWQKETELAESFSKATGCFSCEAGKATAEFKQLRTSEEAFDSQEGFTRRSSLLTSGELPSILDVSRFQLNSSQRLALNLPASEAQAAQVFYVLQGSGEAVGTTLKGRILSLKSLPLLEGTGDMKMDPDTGFNQEAFTKMCNDESDIGCYCNDVELQLILNKLVAAPKKKETKKRPRGYVCRCFAKVSWFTDVNDT